MFGLLFSFLPMIFIGYYFFTMNKRKDISWDLRRGLRCSSCKEDLPNIDESIQNWHLHVYDGEKITTCVSCKRDEAIDSVVGGRKHILSKIRIYFISDKFKILQKILLGILCVFVILDIVCTFSGIKGMSVFSNSFNTLYWIVMLIRRRYTTIKKTPQD